jgi:hypothetical protein
LSWSIRKSGECRPYLARIDAEFLAVIGNLAGAGAQGAQIGDGLARSTIGAWKDRSPNT